MTIRTGTHQGTLSVAAFPVETKSRCRGTEEANKTHLQPNEFALR